MILDAGMAERPPILVGIDFSAGARPAVRWATCLARQLSVPLVAAHVTNEERFDWRPDQLGWMGDVGLDPAASIVQRGVPWIELSRISQTIGATILVVGSHGSSGYQPVVPGSTTVLLLTRSQRPVLVVPGA
ncbi:MAG: universal stress protein [Gemmatimonadetes bacterium]|nr:universal stress protein [Gemmatimonadota bacterium]